MNPSIETRLESKPIETTLKIQIRKRKDIAVPGMEPKKIDIPFDTGQEFLSVNQVLKTPWTELFQKIHATDTKDLFFSLGFGDSDLPISREWLAQKVLMFDFDHADYSRRFEYLDVFAEVAKLPKGFFAATWTGGGIHILVSLKNPIDKKDFFTTNKVAYQIILAKLEAACKKRGLPGKWDPQVFAPQYMSRIPGSINSKYKGPMARVELLQNSLIDVDFDLSKLSGLPQVPAKEMLSKKELAYFKIDTTTVLTGCEFLKYSKQNAAVLSEPEWFAMLSILSRLQGGKELAHEYSKTHPDYSIDRTNIKIEHIKKGDFGPRTCESLESMFPGCKDCKFYKKVKSPVQIKGDKFIATAHSGFQMLVGQNKLVPQYKDLMLFFDDEAPFTTIEDTRSVYRWSGSQWDTVSDVRLENYAQEHFQPFVKSEVTREFKATIQRNNIKPHSWFNESTEGLVNLKNGILNLKTSELSSHNIDLGFRETLPFDYDPKASAPLFTKMIEDVTCGDTKLQKVLQEFFGYIISGEKCHAQKMLIMTGGGQNGKSSIIQIMKALAGSAQTKMELEQTKSDFIKKRLDGALVCFFEEVPRHGDKAKWETLKDWSSGGDIIASDKYEKHIAFENKAKIVISCNELPQGTDPTHGYFRRLLIVPFNADFNTQAGNLDTGLPGKVIAEELSGVFNWALEGLKRLRQQGWQFTKAEAIDEAMEAYKTHVDNCRRFFEDNVSGFAQPSEGDRFAVPTATGVALSIRDMYKEYKIGCDSDGERAVSSKVFTERFLKYILEMAKAKGVRHIQWQKWNQKDRILYIGDQIVRTSRSRVQGDMQGVVYGVSSNTVENF